MKKLSALFFTFLLLTNSAFAENLVIKDIKISGNGRVEPATIEAFLGVKRGQTIAREDLDNAFRRTFDTGLFEDIQIEFQNGILEVDVKENPTVAEVAFDGNDKIDNEKFLAEIKTEPRAVFKESDLQADVKRIMTLYQRSGRFNVRVEPKVEKLENNRVKVTFIIDEGQKAKIAQISFINNFAFDEPELETVIGTKESRWYRFFSGSDNYDPDRIEFDKELLRRHYVSKGYADFKVVSADAEYNNINKSFNIIFTLDEGKHFTFGKIDIQSAIPDLNLDEARGLIKSKEGKEFDAKKLEDTITTLTDYLGEKGYAFTRINPRYNKDDKSQIIGITYEISEGPRVYVNRINIIGNSRTGDEVIRREFRLNEGDPYNSSKIKRSKERIEALGFFSKVDIQNKETEYADKVDLDVGVAEQSTGELTLGAGFSTNDGALGDIAITERNFLGKGQFVRANFTLAAVRQDIRLSFTEPYFMDRQLSTGFDIFNTQIVSQSGLNNLAFDSASTGFTLRSGYPLSEYLSHNVNYTLRQDEITNPQAGASLFVTQQLGEFLSSVIGHSFVYNSLDNQFLPNEGWFASISQDYAGLGGDIAYLKHDARVSYFTPISEEYRDWVVRLSGRGGNVTGMSGKDVRINDRFFVGETLMRGFDNQGIGPRDRVSLDPLGGNNYFVGTSELMFPLGLPEELQIKGAAFTDVGTLYGIDATDPTLQIEDKDSLRGSAGVGVFWRSPVGPIRIDYAEPFAKESFDQLQQIRFSFGTRF
ncbi:MAG: outer membrane protein assembly factor BamA [Rickettsiales bacterium]|nr:outer membrane protein assembly factor BamA [Rickettsiales bacterium]